MELFVVCSVGVVVAALLFREFSGKQKTASSFTSPGSDTSRSVNSSSHDWITDPAYFWMMGNIYYSQHQEQIDGDNSDWMTDPSRSHLPGNIYHQDDLTTSSCSCTGNDWMTDPCCSYMPGNIYHDDHFGSSSSSLSNDDAWLSSGTSSFGDSWSSSSSSFHDD